jgi:hypothetical protein
MDAEFSIRVSQNQVFGGWIALLDTARLHFPLLHARTDGWEALLFFPKDRDGDREWFSFCLGY